LLQRTGGHIIAFLFARHSQYVNESILKPIQAPLLPSADTISKAMDEISSQESIQNTLRKMEIIISIPSPTLISSAIQPLIKNLFLLASYIQDTPQSYLKAQVTHLLEVFITSSSISADEIILLVNTMVESSSDEGWTYTPGDTGGISIRRIVSTDTHELGFNEIIGRIAIIMDLIGKTSDNVKSEIFVRILKPWYSFHEENPLKYFPLSAINSGLLRMFNYYRNF
jgi:hypothetical protein